VDGLPEWLTGRLIRCAENELYGGRPPEYDELLGIFFDQYQRWSTGEYKHLYDTDINAFKIKFGDFISQRREHRPQEYLESLLKRAARQRGVVPCIVFDNADNFPENFQDAVFQYAYSIFRAIVSVVVVPITDRTIWRLSKAGALQSYSAKMYYLPVPSTKSVLEKRVLFIKRKLEDGPDNSREYFTSRALRLKMENLPAFAACVEEAFIKTDFVAKNEKFIALADSVADAVAAAGADSVDGALAASLGGHTVNDQISDDAAIIGEKVELRRVAKVPGDKFAVYLHRTSKDLPPQVGVVRFSREGVDRHGLRIGGTLG